jgi:putative endopeptidase
MTKEQKKYLQIFFKKWTQTLRSNMSYDYIKYLIKNDEHAPGPIRVNAPFSHIDMYYEIYNIREGDNNYLEPEKRSQFINF